MPHVELPQAEFKVVMLGDTNAGKTSLVLRFAEGYYRDEGRSATLGAFFITKRIQTSNGITCKVQIWDTAGQPQFRKMAPMYYKTAAAAIVCYDVTSSKSYSVMREWLDELRQHVSDGSIVIAIAATKSDLAYEAEPSILVPAFEAEELSVTLDAIFVDTSAKTNSNVNLLFQRVSERVLFLREQTKMSNIKNEKPIPGISGTGINEEDSVKSRARNPNDEVMNGTSSFIRSMSEFSDRKNNNEERKDNGSDGHVIEENPSEKSTIMCGGPFMECGSERAEGSRCTMA